MSGKTMAQIVAEKEEINRRATVPTPHPDMTLVSPLSNSAPPVNVTVNNTSAPADAANREISGPPEDQAGFFQTMIGRPLSQAHKSWVRQNIDSGRWDGYGVPKHWHDANPGFSGPKEKEAYLAWQSGRKGPRTAKEAMEVATSEFDVGMTPEPQQTLQYPQSMQVEEKSFSLKDALANPEEGQQTYEEAMKAKADYEKLQYGDGLLSEGKGPIKESVLEEEWSGIERDVAHEAEPEPEVAPPKSRTAGGRSRGQAMSGEQAKKTIAVAIEEMVKSPDAEPWHVALEKRMMADNPMFAALIPGIIQKSVLKHQKAILADNKRQGIAGEKAYTNYLNSMMRHAQAKELTNLRNLPQLRKLAWLKAKDVADGLKNDTMSLTEVGDYLITRSSKVQERVNALLEAKSSVSEGTFGRDNEELIKGFAYALSDDDTKNQEGIEILGLEEGASRKDIQDAYGRKRRDLLNSAVAGNYIMQQDPEGKSKGSPPTYAMIEQLANEALIETLHSAATDEPEVARYLSELKGDNPFLDTVSSLMGSKWQIKSSQGNLKRNKALSRPNKRRNK